MEDTTENKPRKHICAALLAHVDAGKTTLSEAMLYTSGSIRTMGRVDRGDAFLDTDEQEKARGITIFSKQAQFSFGEACITLLDTPGHVDFSAEMERTLQVLDYAILVINGADGVQGHTVTLWQLLRTYQIPVFLFINKMDQEGTDKSKLLQSLQDKLDGGCVDFTTDSGNRFYESIAVCGEELLEAYLSGETIRTELIRSRIAGRSIFPCYFGSALKAEGVDTLLAGIERYTVNKEYPSRFGARVFKINRDEQGNRLTFLKITGGSLKVKDSVKGKEEMQEKVNQIRFYSGAKYETGTEAFAGSVCAVTGPLYTKPGQGFGIEADAPAPVLVPVLTSRLLLPEGSDLPGMVSNLRQLEEEEPLLHIVYLEERKEIQVKMMGEVQTEVLQTLIKKRFGVTVSFEKGNIVYKETIAAPVIGAGHFEPLRHYAEVHLLLEPGEEGSGLYFAAAVSEDELAGNWQRLVLTHLAERVHKGVLTGAALTDMRITLIAGRAHNKHTEGGDFRQATYRAIRQGLMEAESVLLEPYYAFRLEVPETMVGRAMADMERLHAVFEGPFFETEAAVLTGQAPVAAMQGYHQEVSAYTKGHGRLFCSFACYAPCHNAQEVIADMGYEPERDLEHPADSVFCAHGAGFVVEWLKAKSYMHVSSGYEREEGKQMQETESTAGPAHTSTEWIGEDEIEKIFKNTFYANQGEKAGKVRKRIGPVTREITVPKRPGKPLQRKEYLLVDGYNIVFAWEELKELAAVSLEAARGRLLDILANYQAIKGCSLIVVFDAYRVAGGERKMEAYHNIHVVYTKEAETADQYIERFAHENGRTYDVTVATSDGVEQIIIWGQGCRLLSALELQSQVKESGARILADYEEKQEKKKHFFADSLSEQQMEQLRNLADTE